MPPTVYNNRNHPPFRTGEMVQAIYTNQGSYTIDKLYEVVYTKWSPMYLQWTISIGRDSDGMLVTLKSSKFKSIIKSKTRLPEWL